MWDNEDFSDMNQQETESEIELYYALLYAIQQAKELGLSDDHIKTLCYAAGIDFDNLD